MPSVPQSHRCRPGNRGETRPCRTARGQFPPGVSGNPSGRPSGTAGIAARIRTHCGDDFQKLVDAWMVLAFGSASERKTFFGEAVAVSTKDRLTALAELRDTAIGRPRQLEDKTAPDGKDRPPIVIVVEKPPPGQEWRALPIHQQRELSRDGHGGHENAAASAALPSGGPKPLDLPVHPGASANGNSRAAVPSIPADVPDFTDQRHH